MSEPMKTLQLKALSDLIGALATIREKLGFEEPSIGGVDLIIIRTAAVTAADAALFMVESGAWKVE